MIKTLLNKARDVRAIYRWKKAGKPFPPPHAIKRKVVKEYGKGLNTLIETGTYLGDMVEAMRKDFEKVYSIELSRELFLKAQKRFDNSPNVTILQGDSGEILETIVRDLKAPALFWLDGHYSAGFTAKGNKETPIVEELKTIADSKLPHVVLIDDARCFTGEQDYPTMEELEKLSASLGFTGFAVENDIIRLQK